ncbi:hypothetical protein ACFV9C_42580 [Kribbella sp. NPDC059898]|uniref:hypothetical protein n=1 Tax=Kribbella sp. NPDC059898 TaxID=3346995 RepID=UPI003654E9B1
MNGLHQWDSLIGVAVGAVLAAVTAWLNDRRLSKRTDRQQWHQQRLAAYTTAWSRLSDVALAMQEIVSKYGKPRVLAPLAPLRVLQQAVLIQSVLREAGEALTVIRFIGGKEVVDAADRCADVIVKLGAAVGDGDGKPDQLEDLVQEMNTRRHHLVDVARIELDVDPRPFRRRRRPGPQGSSAERIAQLDAPAGDPERPGPRTR